LVASNWEAFDWFGYSLALSRDGNRLAVGAAFEDSDATGVHAGGPTQANDNDGSPGSGAVYLFTRTGLHTWPQEAYVKASNTGENDEFGSSVALSADGNVLAVGATFEGSLAVGVGGDQGDAAIPTFAGAAYVFTRDEVTLSWSQHAYVKASNTDDGDFFGSAVTLSADGQTLVVGARYEDSNSNKVGGDQADDQLNDSGAVYMY
jgi:hypothetical protein